MWFKLLNSSDPGTHLSPPYTSEDQVGGLWSFNVTERLSLGRVRRLLRLCPMTSTG
jgi:hypothetical protein